MSTPNPDKTTLRLLMPQWQGGNNPPYQLGARLLSWLAPVSDDAIEEVPIDLMQEGLEVENGIFARTPLLKQFHAATDILKRRQPDRVVVFGGDCSVNLAPFAYLNERYKGDLAVLWVDAHPDVDMPGRHSNIHGMVLGILLGEGDEEFVAALRRPIDPAKVMLVGLNDERHLEKDVVKRLSLPHVTPEQFASTSDAILDWLKQTGASHVAIHFDVDVIDVREFRSQLSANPIHYKSRMDTALAGSSMAAITRMLQDVAKAHDVVGIGITEHYPWDAIALSNMLERLPLIGDDSKQ